MFRSRAVPFLIVASLFFGCRSDKGKPIAPADSYVLFVPSEDGGKADGALKVEKANVNNQAVQPVPGLLESGFASEMLRTVYLAGQYLRDATVDGHRFSDLGRANGSLPLCLVVGVDQTPYGRGLAIKGGFGGYSVQAAQPWIGIPPEPSRDKALIQALAGRFASYAASLVATAGLLDAAPAPPPKTLLDGYRMAMEVVAREWRHGVGPAGVIQFDEGTKEQQSLFADVRENRYVLDEGGAVLRSPPQLLDSPGVTATVLYRMAQARGVGPRVAPEAFYAPYAKDRMPPKVSPAAILGPFRNFQAKLLGVWAASVLRGKAPKDIVDLVEAYGEALPAERLEAVRIFVVTTFGGTVKPGGFSMQPEASRQTLAELTAITAEVVAGKRSLRDAFRPASK
jgi:hypothetical protein